MLPLLVFAPARSRGTAFIEGFRSPNNVILYEPLNPRVRWGAPSSTLHAQSDALGHPQGFDYFRGLWEINAGDIFPESLITAWRQCSFSLKQRDSIAGYVRRLALTVAQRGKRPVFKFEHPLLFQIASLAIIGGVTIGLSRPSAERLDSYWRQVKDKNNHYFFHRDLAWRLTHPKFKNQAWRALARELAHPEVLYNQSFSALDTLCHGVVASCHLAVDANSGRVTKQDNPGITAEGLVEAKKELGAACLSLRSHPSEREHAYEGAESESLDRVRSVRNYTRLCGTIARGMLDLGAD